MGTYRIKEKEAIYKAIVDVGYRHLDTAKVYENEEIVGEALQQALKDKPDLKREDFFVTTKLWHHDYADPEAAIKESL